MSAKAQHLEREREQQRLRAWLHDVQQRQHAYLETRRALTGIHAPHSASMLQNGLPARTERRVTVPFGPLAFFPSKDARGVCVCVCLAYFAAAAAAGCSRARVLV
jgi:hypothetical protein